MRTTITTLIALSATLGCAAPVQTCTDKAAVSTTAGPEPTSFIGGYGGGLGNLLSTANVDETALDTAQEMLTMGGLSASIDESGIIGAFTSDVVSGLPDQTVDASDIISSTQSYVFMTSGGQLTFWPTVTSKLDDTSISNSMGQPLQTTAAATDVAFTTEQADSTTDTIEDIPSATIDSDGSCQPATVTITQVPDSGITPATVTVTVTQTPDAETTPAAASGFSGDGLAPISSYDGTIASLPTDTASSFEIYSDVTSGAVISTPTDLPDSTLTDVASLPTDVPSYDSTTVPTAAITTDAALASGIPSQITQPADTTCEEEEAQATSTEAIGLPSSALPTDAGYVSAASTFPTGTPADSELPLATATAISFSSPVDSLVTATPTIPGDGPAPLATSVSIAGY